MMNFGLREVGQFLVVLAVTVGTVALSDWPVYRRTPEGTGVVMLSFVHHAVRDECRRRTPEELAKLPPNMRKPQECPRGRKPLYVEFDIDGRLAFKASLPPTGIAGDGPSRVYQRFVLPVGQHELAVRMRDTARTEGFDHQRAERVALGPDQMLVVDYREESKGFVFR